MTHLVLLSHLIVDCRAEITGNLFEVVTVTITQSRVTVLENPHPDPHPHPEDNLLVFYVGSHAHRGLQDVINKIQ